MTPKPIIDNTLFYGDNLPILRECVPDESVDLIYLDPTFSSNRSYNALFRDECSQEVAGSCFSRSLSERTSYRWLTPGLSWDHTLLMESVRW